MNRKFFVFAVLAFALILGACNLPSASTAAPNVTETSSVYAQPLSTNGVETMVALMTPLPTITPTPFKPLIARLTFNPFWNDTSGVGLVARYEKYGSGPDINLPYEFIVNGELHSSGQIKPGDNMIGIDPNGVYTFEFKISGVKVVSGENGFVTPIYVQDVYQP